MKFPFRNLKPDYCSPTPQELCTYRVTITPMMDSSSNMC